MSCAIFASDFDTFVASVISSDGVVYVFLDYRLQGPKSFLLCYLSIKDEVMVVILSYHNI